MSERTTRATLASGKVTLSVAPKRRMFLHKIQAMAEKKKKSVSEQVWDLYEHGLEEQTGASAKREGFLYRARTWDGFSLSTEKISMATSWLIDSNGPRL